MENIQFEPKKMTRRLDRTSNFPHKRKVARYPHNQLYTDEFTLLNSIYPNLFLTFFIVYIYQGYSLALRNDIIESTLPVLRFKILEHDLKH